MRHTRTFLLAATAGAFALVGCTTDRADPGLEDSPPTEAAAEITNDVGYADWDADADDMLNRQEFGSWAATEGAHDRWRGSAGPDGIAPGEDFDRMVWTSWDSDRSEGIDEEEWGRGTEAFYGDDVDYGAWSDWDADGDSELDLNELSEGLETHDMYDRVDLDHDLLIDDEELADWWFDIWDLNDDQQVDTTEWDAARDAWGPEVGTM